MCRFKCVGSSVCHWILLLIFLPVRSSMSGSNCRVLTGDNAANPWERALLVVRSVAWFGSGLRVFTGDSDAWFCQQNQTGRHKCANSTAWREIMFILKMRWNFNDPAGKLGGCSGNILLCDSSKGKGNMENIGYLTWKYKLGHVLVWVQNRGAYCDV